MSANSSSSLLQPQPSSLLLLFSVDQHCFITKPSSFIFIIYNVSTIVFLLPLIILVFYAAWQRKRSHAWSHFDYFSCHTTIIEIFCVIKLIPNFLGVRTNNILAVFVGSVLSSFVWYGETSFQVLTCADHYLAVVQPLTYRSLRNKRGTRIRNVCIGFVWLLCFLRMGLYVNSKTGFIVDFFLVVISLLITLFCNLSALRVLIRPGPGEPARERPDRSKQKAFYTMVIILCILAVRFVSSLIWAGICVTHMMNNECLIMAGIIWCNLPSSLVLPLLFLHKRRKFVCCKNKK
ncbi:uncharacterized protein LOC122820705 [Gambusia affinis]|uniref:uncharacterized protein LOC122820705 n=1 Tax=Gambusia affinis TaxID=33528 RepID=UPI001CDD1442|nr:uncharacterized protein LOC122820705 [Gambusia affinis]